MNIIPTNHVNHDVRSGSQVLDELSIIKRTDNGVYAELLQFFRFPRVSNKGSKFEIIGLRMIKEAL